MTAMTGAERLAWINRLEREAFGQRIPDDAAYAARLGLYRVLALLWMVGLLLCAPLLPMLWGNWLPFFLLPGFFCIAAPLLAWVFARQSLTWRWYLLGSLRLARLGSVPPWASWRGLQQWAHQSSTPALQTLAHRRWVDYQTALTALGRPPPPAILWRGVGDLLRWLPF
jgi:drug/metabolite transporter superfamily protein YnfA